MLPKPLQLAPQLETTNGRSLCHVRILTRPKVHSGHRAHPLESRPCRLYPAGCAHCSSPVPSESSSSRTARAEQGERRGLHPARCGARITPDRPSWRHKGGGSLLQWPGAEGTEGGAGQCRGAATACESRSSRLRAPGICTCAPSRGQSGELPVGVRAPGHARGRNRHHRFRGEPARRRGSAR